MDDTSEPPPIPSVRNTFDGGTARAVVQAGVVNLVTRAATPQALDGLPPRPNGLAGRTEPLGRVLATLHPRSGDGTGALALLGPPGVGKTTLALEAAHLAVSRGWFPGGVLYANLRTHHHGRSTTYEELLGSFLRMLGIADGDVPASRTGLEALLRTRLREREDAVLVLLDDVGEPELVAPALPTGGRHRLLVTAREHIELDGMETLRLAPLDPAGSRAMLTAVLDGSDPAVLSPAELDELAGLCGHLPLPMRVAAARVREEGTPRDLLAALRVETERLAELDLGEGLSVRAAFDASYRCLEDADARFFRLLGLHPGTEIDEESAAALAGLPVAEARRALRRLCRYGLLQPAADAGRVRFHDLLRLYAHERAAGGPPGEAEAAEARLSGHWERGIGGHGLVWLDRESASLLAAVEQAARRGRHEQFRRLAVPLTEHLVRRARLPEALLVQSLRIADVQRTGDRAAEVDLLLEMARMYDALGRGKDAFTCRRGAGLIGNQIGLTFGHGGLEQRTGDFFAELGDSRLAAAAHRSAARWHLLRRQPRSRVLSLIALGEDYARSKRPSAAGRVLRRAARVAERASDHVGLARVHLGLGRLREQSGDPEAALEHYERALALAEEQGLVGERTAARQRIAGMGRSADDAGAADVQRPTGPAPAEPDVPRPPRPSPYRLTTTDRLRVFGLPVLTVGGALVALAVTIVSPGPRPSWGPTLSWAVATAALALWARCEYRVWAATRDDRNYGWAAFVGGCCMLTLMGLSLIAAFTKTMPWSYLLVAPFVLDSLIRFAPSLRNFLRDLRAGHGQR
ncbi:tetratricopeptide repeat protein [Streptomyces sp. NPDC001678]|uniref:tetratricopeptide repeat protein n=1 Tax=Streptomyces sp. NPDC001678 TaxID=3364599 RepID=UPI0036CCB558